MATRAVEHPPAGARLVTVEEIRSARERVAGIIRPIPVDRF